MSTDYRVSMGKDGQLFVEQGREQVLHADCSDPACPEIQLASHHGNNQVVLDKLYGPMVGIPIRITVDTERNAWVVERQQRDNRWGEVASIPLQMDSDFGD